MHENMVLSLLPKGGWVALMEILRRLTKETPKLWQLCIYNMKQQFVFSGKARKRIRRHRWTAILETEDVCVWARCDRIMWMVMIRDHKSR
jgi:hypothetical protein